MVDAEPLSWLLRFLAFPSPHNTLLSFVGDKPLAQLPVAQTLEDDWAVFLDRCISGAFKPSSCVHAAGVVVLSRVRLVLFVFWVAVLVIGVGYLAGSFSGSSNSNKEKQDPPTEAPSNSHSQNKQSHEQLPQKNTDGLRSRHTRQSDAAVTESTSSTASPSSSSSTSSSSSSLRKLTGRAYSLSKLIPNIVLRKYYHALVVVMFLPGILLEPRLVGLAFSGALAIFMVIEYMRYPRVPPWGFAIHEFMRTYLDDRDAGDVILTHIYLLLGCALPLWLHLRWFEHHLDHFMPALAGVIILGVGDSAASLFGSYFGKHKWPGSKKSLEGTFGAIVTVLALSWAVCAYHGDPAAANIEYRSAFDCILTLPSNVEHSVFGPGLVIATVLTCLLESFTDQIDNLFLPLYYYAVLQLFS